LCKGGGAVEVVVGKEGAERNERVGERKESRTWLGVK
jgi:hypothetical protein